MIYFLTARGTAEPFEGPQTMLKLVANEAGPGIRWIDVHYPASISVFNDRWDLFGDSLKKSLDVAAISFSSQVEAVLAQDPTATIVLGGYSLGAMAVNQWLLTGPPHLVSRVRRVIYIANPVRPQGDSYFRASFGCGIARAATARPPGVQIFNLCNPTDAISSIHPKSPLRNLVPWLYALDINKPHEWFTHVLQQAQQGALRETQSNIFDAGWRDGVARMPNDLYGYAFGGQHTLAYGHTEWQGQNAIQVAGRLVRTA